LYFGLHGRVNRTILFGINTKEQSRSYKKKYEKQKKKEFGLFGYLLLFLGAVSLLFLFMFLTDNIELNFANESEEIGFTIFIELITFISLFIGFFLFIYRSKLYHRNLRPKDWLLKRLGLQEGGSIDERKYSVFSLSLILLWVLCLMLAINAPNLTMETEIFIMSILTIIVILLISIDLRLKRTKNSEQHVTIFNYYPLNLTFKDISL